jgi:hypothetical protein
MTEISETSALRFYPAYCFELSPTWNHWVKVTAREVHAFDKRGGWEGRNLLFFIFSFMPCVVED